MSTALGTGQGQLKKSIESGHKNRGKLSSFADASLKTRLKKNPQRPKCGCKEKGPCIAPPTPKQLDKFGRKDSTIKVATMFYEGESKRQLLSGPGLEIIELNTQESLVEQWKSLVESQRTPDVVIAKITNAICKRDHDENANTAYNNYLEWQNKMSSEEKEKELMPIQAQYTLCDRSKMETAIHCVCEAVNQSFGLNMPRTSSQRDSNAKSKDSTSPSMNSAAEAAASVATAAASVAAEAAEAVTANPKPDDIADSAIVDEHQISSLHHFPCVGPKSFFIEKGNDQGQNENASVNGSQAEDDQSDDLNAALVMGNPTQILIASVLKSLPFPLVAKALSASIKTKAIIFDAVGLAHFRQKVDSDLMVEEYIPHGNVIIKLYNVGDSVFVVERPSFPDFNSNLTDKEMEKLSNEINGEIVRVPPEEAEENEDEHEEKGEKDEEGERRSFPESAYIVFSSAAMIRRHPPLRAGKLDDEQFQHLDKQLLRRIALASIVPALSRHPKSS